MTPGSPPPTNRSGKAGTIIIIGFLIPFCIGGMVAAGAAVHSFLSGDYQKGTFLAIFALTFGGGACAMLAMALHGRKRAARSLTLRSAHPSEPWKWREDWAEGISRANTKGTMLFAWLFAILWNLISIPLLFVLPSEIFDKHNYAALLGLLFPIVGVGLMIWAVRKTIEWRKFGQSIFRMSTLPGVIGGDLTGSVEVPAGFDPGQDFDVTLSCVNRKTTGSGKTQSTTETVLWQEQARSVKAIAGTEAMGTGVPVQFVIPSDCRQVDESVPRDVIVWRLKAHAAVPGVDYDATFEVPVFRTSASRAGGPGAALAEDALPPGYQPGEGSGISTGVGWEGGTELAIRPNPAAGPLASMTAFLFIWIGLVILMVHLAAPVLLSGVFGLFGLLFLYILLQLAFGNARILITTGSVTVHNGLGPISSTTTIPSGEIESVAATIGMQSGASVMYSVTLTRRGGKRLVVRAALREKHDAVWIASRIREGIGLQ